jgi:hypothetical protein
VVRPAARREAVAYLRQVFEMSEQRACRVIGGDRTSVRYHGVLGLTRIGGHPEAFARGATDAQNTPAVFT